MKTHVLLLVIALLSFNCNGQKNETKKLESKETNPAQSLQPQGSWTVNKEFDEYGNLIRYDSISSWSSNDFSYNLSGTNKDSLLQSLKSRFFANFSEFEGEGFEAIFSQDSLFSRKFFNDDFFGSHFGKDFMDIDSITQNMMSRQRKFLEKYQSEFIRSEKNKRTEQDKER